jgi:diguanylate cyclase (GGDEF)-like protein
MAAVQAASGPMPRCLAYALFGACLAQGAAAGLLLLHVLDDGLSARDSVAQELADHLATYVYVAVSTTAAFALFGMLLGRSADRLAQLASTDALTGLLNAGAFPSQLHAEIERARRYRQPLSMLIVDLDGLKRVNDQQGHQAGDTALHRVAVAMREGLRQPDLSARIGGDEFAVIAPNTGESAAVVLAERLRTLVARNKIGAPGFGITVSIGIASLVPPAGGRSSVRRLMRVADAALYQAKHAGGNTVRLLHPERPECQAEIIRPQENREDRLPEGQVKKSDCKQPCGKPQRAREGVLLDSDLLHLTNSLLTRR